MQPAIPSTAVDKARSKIFWGESKEQVIADLLREGVSETDAKTLVSGLLQERAQSIRADGVRKIIVGLALILIPSLFCLFSFWLTFISLRAFYVTLVPGVIGLFKVSKGVWMVTQARFITGDISDLEGWV